jgi:8-oxo-dGTP pyrophosphatase MutT (NUDIX family)
MMPRSKVIISIVNREEVLLAELYDPGRNHKLHIPVGGGVEFGETIHEAAVRELQEELGIRAELEFLSFNENFFEYDNTPGHEIVFHFLGRIDDSTRANLPVHGIESNGESFPIRWYSVEDLYNIRERMVPQAVFGEIVSGLT